MSIIPPNPRMERHVRHTHMILVWESAWPCLVPVLSVALLIVGLTLTGAFEFLPPTGHIILLSLLSVALCAALVLPWRKFRLPMRRDVLRRLERDNHLENDPLQSLDDQIAKTDDPLTDYLWQRQLGVHERLLDKLRLPRPAPALSRIDPFGLTAIPVLLLALGLFVGHDQFTDRFSKAFSPLQRLGTADFSATLWVTPPAYTGQIPRVLRFSQGIGQTDGRMSPPPDQSQSATSPPAASQNVPNRTVPNQADNAPPSGVMTVDVPVGATLSGTIGSIWEPVLKAPNGERALSESSDNSYVLSTALDQSGPWSISVWGNDRLTLDVNLIADRPPSLSFIRPPTVTRRDHLRMDYVARDDYGMRSLDLVITPAPDETGLDPYGPIDQIVIDLKGETPETTTMPTRIEGPRFVDLVAHPWAGLPVNMQLVSGDNAGQTGQSDLRVVMLPEREFTHPVAQKLIAIRRGLLRHPERALEMYRALLPVLHAPHAFNGDIGIFLALSVATNRLVNHLYDRTAHQDVSGLLWHVAEEIERGSYGIAERNLMEAEERLLEALADPNVTEAEISALIDAYRQALNEYLAAMTRDTPRVGDMQNLPNAALEQQDLSRIIDQIDALTRAGARDQARQLIDRLRQLVENMQVTTGEGGMDITSVLREMLDGMRDLARRQQDLMNQGDIPGGNMGTGQRALGQQGLADDADALTRSPGFGQFGDQTGLNAAIDAMRRAGEALRNNRSHEALRYQEQAMQALQQGIGELSRVLEGLSQLAPMLEGLEGAGRRDPLGRPVGGDGTTIIPDVDTLERAWRILQELRRRSGDPARPQIEQDYIDRLLKRF